MATVKNDVLTGSGRQETFVIHHGDGIITISDFGGVGTGVNPTAAVIDEVDILKFEGEGLTAQNMLLTQQGDDLLITFEGVDDTQVVLKDFDLEDLDNLQTSTGASVNIGNILFDGQTQIQDSFDVIDANWNPPQVFNPNTVTFLNDRDNDIEGLFVSDDVINGQGGNDRLVGLYGDDTLYGGDGKDILYGDSYDVYFSSMTSFGDGNDILYGGDGNDMLYADYQRRAYGMYVSDVLYGGNGDDTLYGSQNDILNGEVGNDIYVIRYSTDTILEASNTGTDLVESYISYTLDSNLENLTLKGAF